MITTVMESRNQLPVALCKTLIQYQSILKLVPLFLRDTLPKFAPEAVSDILKASDFWHPDVLVKYNNLLYTITLANRMTPKHMKTHDIVFPKQFHVMIKQLFQQFPKQETLKNPP